MKKILLIVSLTILTLAACDHGYAARMLFRSHFGPGVSLAAPSDYFPTKTGAWQDIVGTDKLTGYSWPPKAYDFNRSAIQMITKQQITAATLSNHISSEIRSVAGPFGTTVRELHTEAKKLGKVGECCEQAPLMLTRPHNVGDMKEVWMSYWFKHDPKTISNLSNSIPNGHYRVQFEFKTGGYNGTGGGDYRISTTIIKGADGKPYWVTSGDNNANTPNMPFQQHWRIANHTVPVPVDKWFRYEVYWNRSSGSDGRFWTAVNGQVIADYKGPTMGKYNLPVTRLMVTNAYTGGSGPSVSRLTGFEIFDTWPCGQGIPCFGK